MWEMRITIRTGRATEFFGRVQRRQRHLMAAAGNQRAPLGLPALAAPDAHPQKERKDELVVAPYAWGSPATYRTSSKHDWVENTGTLMHGSHLRVVNPKTTHRGPM